MPFRYLRVILVTVSALGAHHAIGGENGSIGSYGVEFEIPSHQLKDAPMLVKGVHSPGGHLHIDFSEIKKAWDKYEAQIINKFNRSSKTERIAQLFVIGDSL